MPAHSTSKETSQAAFDVQGLRAAAWVGVQEVEQAPVGSLGCIVQRRASPAVLQACIAVGRQEQGRHKRCLAAAGHVQRRKAAVTLRVHVCASLHRHPSHPAEITTLSAHTPSVYTAHGSAKDCPTNAGQKMPTGALVQSLSVRILTILNILEDNLQQVEGVQYEQIPSQPPSVMTEVGTGVVACLYQQGC